MPQEQMPVLVVLTDVRPVTLILISLSWLPAEGVERQSFSVDEVAPAPLDWKLTLYTSPVSR